MVVSQDHPRATFAPRPIVPRRFPFSALALGVMLACLLDPSPAAFAQDETEAPQTRPAQGGLATSALAPTPAPSRSTDAGAWSLRTNPGGLAFTQGFETSVSTVVGDSPNAPVGWYTALGSGAGFGFGFGADWLDARYGTTSTRWGLAFGSERIGLGVARVHWRGLRTEGARDRSATDVGAQLRATRWLALGLVGENLEGREIPGIWRGRAWTASTALRVPSGMAELDLAATLPEGLERTDAVLAATATARFPGLRVHVRGATDARGDATGRDWQVQAGAELVFGVSAIGGGARVDGDGLESSFITASIHVPFRASLFSSRDLLLRIDLAGDIPERGNASPFGGEARGLTDVIELLQRVAREADMAGVYLNLGGVTAGGAQLWELRRALDEVRTQGQLVVVYLQQATFRDLYLAGAADVVIVAPNVQVLDGGFRIERTYLADLIRRLGLETQFVRIGPWKSAVERFERSGPSDEANEDLDRFLDVAWSLVRDGIGTRAELDGEAVEQMLARLPLLPSDLVQRGIADAEGWPEDVPRILSERLGRRLRASRTYGGVPTRDESFFPAMRVAVLHLDGGLVDGRGGFSLLTGSRTTGSTDVAEACEAIQRRSDIDAVLVRVDSSGGSALASDVMVHAIARLATRKPTVVSFGDVAASGGYYVAAFPTRIFAAPNTLTGSIGIYAGAVSIDDAVARFGVAFDRRTRGGVSGLFGVRPWGDEERATAQRSIEAAYELFLSRVATARGRDRDAIDEVGQGHIWSGRDAAERGLVDELSGVGGALDELRRRTGNRQDVPIELVHYPERGLFQLAAGGLRLVRVETPPDATWLAAFPQIERVLALLEPVATTPDRPLAHLPIALDGW